MENKIKTDTMIRRLRQAGDHKFADKIESRFQTPRPNSARKSKQTSQARTGTQSVPRPAGLAQVKEEPDQRNGLSPDAGRAPPYETPAFLRSPLKFGRDYHLSEEELSDGYVSGGLGEDQWVEHPREERAPEARFKRTPVRTTTKARRSGI